MEIETVDTPKYQIQINSSMLEMVKQKYGIADWGIQFRSSFSFLPNTANWNDKKIIMRPFNIWSYVLTGSSIDKRNKQLPKTLAHELRHAQQEPLSTLSLIKHGYWFDPTEREARKWASEHWEEFAGIIKMTSSPH